MSYKCVVHLQQLHPVHKQQLWNLASAALCVPGIQFKPDPYWLADASPFIGHRIFSLACAKKADAAVPVLGHTRRDRGPRGYRAPSHIAADI